MNEDVLSSPAHRGDVPRIVLSHSLRDVRSRAGHPPRKAHGNHNRRGRRACPRSDRGNLEPGVVGWAEGHDDNAERDVPVPEPAGRALQGERVAHGIQDDRAREHRDLPGRHDHRRRRVAGR